MRRVAWQKSSVSAQRRGRVRRGGSAVVEFALVMPVQLALLMGIMEFGWLYRNHLTIANATREGARSASLGNTTSAIQSRNATSASPLSVASPSGSVTMVYSTDNGATYPNTLGNDTLGTKNNAPVGSLIRVRVNSTYKPLTGFFPFLKNRQLTVTVAMRRELA